MNGTKENWKIRLISLRRANRREKQETIAFSNENVYTKNIY